MPEDLAAAAEKTNWRGTYARRHGLVLVIADTTAVRVVFASTCILGVFVFFQAFLLNDHVRLIARNKTFIDYLAVHSNPFLVRPRAFLRKH